MRSSELSPEPKENEMEQRSCFLHGDYTGKDACPGCYGSNVLSRQHQLVEEIAVFIEHLRDDYLSQAEPVQRVARKVRERFGAVPADPARAEALEEPK